MTNDDLAAQLSTIAEHAPKLRAAGITGLVKVGEVEFVVEPEVVFDDDDDEQMSGPSPASALDDPMTHNGSKPRSGRRELMGQSNGERRG